MQLQRGIRELERRVSLLPADADALQSLGEAYYRVGRVDEALRLLLRAHSLFETAECELQIVWCLNELGQFDDAEQWVRMAVEKGDRRPANFALHLTHADSLLRLGRYREAWQIYERGRPTKRETRLHAEIPAWMPEWHGESIETPLLVLGEGGVGDRICYSRFLPWLTKRGIKYCCFIDQGFDNPPTVLGSLFGRLPWIDRGERQAGCEVGGRDFSHWTTTFSLMAALNISAGDVAPVAPWYADQKRVAAMKLPPDPRPTFGLVWRAGEFPASERKHRSMNEWQASRLVTQTEQNVRWVNLQHEFTAPSGVVNLPRFETWDDTAAAIMQCDLVVTVDTGVMHLAAALGKPIWVVLCGNSDWKYGLTGSSPWYPDARLFRNGRAWGCDNSLRELLTALRSGEATAALRGAASGDR